MLVAGFDPGSVCFGLGILEREKREIGYVYSEEIQMASTRFYDRMKLLWERLDHVFSRYRIEGIAVEEGFMGKNVHSMNLLALVRGVTMGFAIHKTVDMSFYSPRQVKLAVTGSGRAMKSQITKSMKLLLKIGDRNLGSDESDALAVAYCHLLNVK